jgi:hypothetical protein
MTALAFDEPIDSSKVVPLGQNLSVRTHTSAMGVTLEVSKPLSMITTDGFSDALAGTIPTIAIATDKNTANLFMFLIPLILLL